MTSLAKLLSLGLLGFAGTLHATTVFWVAPDGRDDAAGTQGRPFATLGRAAVALREHIKKPLQDDVAVRLRAGTYRLDRPLELTPEELGDGRFAVTFTAHQGERVVLSGARELGGTWQRVEGSLQFWHLRRPQPTGALANRAR